MHKTHEFIINKHKEHHQRFKPAPDAVQAEVKDRLAGGETVSAAQIKAPTPTRGQRYHGVIITLSKRDHNDTQRQRARMASLGFSPIGENIRKHRTLY